MNSGSLKWCDVLTVIWGLEQSHENGPPRPGGRILSGKRRRRRDHVRLSVPARHQNSQNMSAVLFGPVSDGDGGPLWHVIVARAQECVH